MSHAIHQVVPIHDHTINNENQPTVDARELHFALKVGRDFTSWMKGRVNDSGFAEGQDYVMFEDLSSPESGSAKSRPQYRKEYSGLQAA